MSAGFSIGMGEGRNSSKVLKPPGGGSSDIFGTQSIQPILQKQENHQSEAKPPASGSNDIFGTQSAEPAVEKQEENQLENQTKERLVAADPEPITPGKTYRNKSSIFGGEEPATRKEGKKKFVRRNPITGEIIEMQHDKNDEKDGEETNGDNKTSGAGAKTNGETNGVVEQPAQPIIKPTSVRVRQPPGGQSSGIF